MMTGLGLVENELSDTQKAEAAAATINTNMTTGITGFPIKVD